MVTVEATASDDCEYYDNLNVWSCALQKYSGGGYGYSNIRGRSDLVYQDNPDNAGHIWGKGETHTFVYGVMADDEVFSESCLYFESRQVFVDDSAETAEVVNDYTCIMLKDGAAG